MALRRCLRTDFLLGFRHQIADALDCTGIELLGPSIGDQSPFDEALSHRPSDQSNQRPRDERASAAASGSICCGKHPPRSRGSPSLPTPQWDPKVYPRPQQQRAHLVSTFRCCSSLQTRFEEGFAEAERAGAQALLVMPTPFYNLPTVRQQLGRLALRHRLPSMCEEISLGRQVPQDLHLPGGQDPRSQHNDRRRLQPPLRDRALLGPQGWWSLLPSEILPASLAERISGRENRG
jgi:hypothetical protein